MNEQSQSQELKSSETILSKNLQGHYVAVLYKGRSVYSDWDTLVKDRFVEEPEVELKSAVLKKDWLLVLLKMCVCFSVLGVVNQ